MATDTCLFIGTDEAGYGPTMGPLVIVATLWQAPSNAPPETWYTRLAPAVLAPHDPALSKLRKLSGKRRKPSGDHAARRMEAAAGGDRTGTDFASAAPPCVIGDSKQVYRSHRGFPDLEHAAMTLLRWCGVETDTWRELLRRLDPAAFADCIGLPWFADFHAKLPLSINEGVTADAVTRSALAVRQIGDTSGVRLLDLRCRFLCEPRFNALVREHESKGRLLSLQTLDLVCDLLNCHADGREGWVYCDKHGGRNRYSEALYTSLAPDWIEILHEGQEESRYRLGHPREKWEIRFTARADQLLPVAASSLIAKYLRELAMRAMNAFWTARLPGLPPTAGYPQDAERMLQSIADLRESLGIPTDWVRRLK